LQGLQKSPASYRSLFGRNKQPDRQGKYICTKRKSFRGGAERWKPWEVFKGRNVKCSRMYDKNLALLKATNLTSICCVYKEKIVKNGSC